MVKNAAPVLSDNVVAYVDSAAFNYNKNGLKYKITFFEFGAIGYVACRKMERVMEKIKLQYPDKVNIIFLNILKPENQTLMEYYGIAVVPIQVLLNNKGVDFLGYDIQNKKIKKWIKEKYLIMDYRN